MASREEIDRMLMEEMQDLSEDDTQDSQDEQMLNTQEFQEGYGAPEPEQAFNKHAFIFESLKEEHPEKITYLNESELGRPLFNMRFLLDIEDISKYYLDDLLGKYGIKNKISAYFRDKIKNTADSGLSNQGFIQNMNITSKMDTLRKRVRGNINNLKGGKPVTRPE